MEDNGKQEEIPAEKILAFLDESSTSRPKKKSDLIVSLLRQVAQKLSSIQITEKQSRLEEILIQSSQKMIQLPISGLKYLIFISFMNLFLFILKMFVLFRNMSYVLLKIDLNLLLCLFDLFL